MTDRPARSYPADGSAAGSVIAVDGKTLRCNLDRSNGREALHLISVWAAETGLGLGQRRVPDHANESSTPPAALGVVTLSGTIITFDAVGYRREVAITIPRRGRDYFLALKGNQPQTHADVRVFFVDGLRTGFSATVTQSVTIEKGHGRIEKRPCWATENAK